MICRHITSGATELGPDQIEALNTKIELIGKDMSDEIKAQKIADGDGKLGWKLVKEYEGPDL